MRRFSGMYMGEDPDAPNYDPEHKDHSQHLERQPGTHAAPGDPL